jgi:hypothetical protein
MIYQLYNLCSISDMVFVNDVLESMWKEAVMDCFKVQYKNLLGLTKKTNLSQDSLPLGKVLEPRTSQIQRRSGNHLTTVSGPKL